MLKLAHSTRLFNLISFFLEFLLDLGPIFTPICDLLKLFDSEQVDFFHGLKAKL